VLADLLNELERGNEPGSGQAVELRDHDALGCAVANALHHRVEPWPHELAARLVNILVARGDLDAA
jgi:hypothetical protein